MTSPLTTAFVLLCACAMSGAYAGDVYKCTTAQGGIAFQDHTCAAGDTETAIHVAPAPAVAPVANDNDPQTPVAQQPPAAAPASMPPIRKPLPPLWACERPEDGTRYMSRDGVTQPRMVPAGVLGIPGKSLATASGANSVSAPGMRKIPVDRSAQAAVAGDYVAVQDTCVRATREQTCDYLNEQYDQVHEKLRRAFKDERAVLQPQEDELNDQLDGC
jgi:hypothetical protein